MLSSIPFFHKIDSFLPIIAIFLGFFMGWGKNKVVRNKGFFSFQWKENAISMLEDFSRLFPLQKLKASVGE